MVIKVRNLDKCIKKFQNIQGIDLSDPIRTGTEIVQEEAQKLAPKDTGILYTSIARYPLHGNSYNLGGMVYTPTEYAIYQEFGFTDRGGNFHEGVHFMSRALNMWGNYIERMVSDYIKTYLRLKSA